MAYHEAGHAVAGWYLEHADPLLKVKPCVWVVAGCWLPEPVSTPIGINVSDV